MRILALVLAVVGASLAMGCVSTPDTTFYWDSRLVPMTPHMPVVSGTGATEYVGRASMP